MSVHLVADGIVARINPITAGLGQPGYGPTVWAGELRTFDTDRPIPATRQFHKTVYPAAVGATEEAVLDDLRTRAEAITKQSTRSRT